MAPGEFNNSFGSVVRFKIIFLKDQCTWSYYIYKPDKAKTAGHYWIPERLTVL
jgi:hypothetical protein